MNKKLEEINRPLFSELWNVLRDEFDSELNNKLARELHLELWNGLYDELWDLDSELN